MHRQLVLLVAVIGCGSRTGLLGADALAVDAAADEFQDEAIDAPPIVTNGCRSNHRGSPVRPAPAIAYGLAETTALPESLTSTAIGDVTGDGRADVVGVNEAGSWVFPQLDDGSLGTPLRVSEGGHAVAVFSLRGQPAFLVGSRTALVTLRVTATGKIEVVNRTPSANVHELTLGDVDNDGFVDVVASIRDSQSITTFLGDGSGSFPRTQTMSFAASAHIFVHGVVLADIDPSPGLELAVLLNEPYLGIVHRNATGVWDRDLATGVWTPASYSVLNVADMDGDGLADLILGGRSLELSGPGAVVVRQEPSGAFAELPWAPSRPPRNTLAVAARDVDGDGQADFVAVVGEDTINSSLSLFFGRGNSRIAGPNVALGPLRDSSDVVVGDIDCDGCPDVIVNGARIFRGFGCAR